MWYLLITLFIAIAVILGISDGEEHLKTLLQALLVIIAGCLLISWIAKLMGYRYGNLTLGVVLLSVVVIVGLIILLRLVWSVSDETKAITLMVVILSFLALGTGTFFASRQYYADVAYEQFAREQEQKHSDQIDSILKNKKEIEVMTLLLLCDGQQLLDDMHKSTLDDMQRTYNVGRKRILENWGIYSSMTKDSSTFNTCLTLAEIDSQMDSLSILLDALIHPDTLAVPETPVEDEDYPIGPDEKRAYGDDAVYTPAPNSTTTDDTKTNKVEIDKEDEGCLD